MQSLLVSYAQNHEDLILEAFFKDVKKGFYVDVGANHPIKHSVTKLFYKKGWRGIHIEPNEGLCAMLRFDRPDDVVLNVGVSDKPGKLEFTEYINHGLSTFSKTMSNAYQQHKSVFTDTFWKYDVTVRTLAEILREQNVDHIHFMKVDVEGYEYEVLDGNDWRHFRPEMICIESNHIEKDWRPLLKKHKYTKVFNDGLNDYYLAEESMYRADHFSYAKSLLESGEVATAEVFNKIKETEQNLVLAKLHLEYMQGQKIRAEYQASWYENAPLRWMIRKTLHAANRMITNRLRPNLAEPRVVFDSDARVQVKDKSVANQLIELTRSYGKSVHTLAPQNTRTLGYYVRRILWILYTFIRLAAKKMLAVAKRGRKK